VKSITVLIALLFALPTFAEEETYFTDAEILRMEEAKQKELLKKFVVRSQSLANEIANLVDYFGVEVSREPNFKMKQSGSIHGEMLGLNSPKPGKLEALATWVFALDAQTRHKKGPYDVDSATSNLIRDLSSLGFVPQHVQGGLSGSLHGRFQGEAEGHHIHELPNLYVLLAKNVDFLTAHLEGLKRLEAVLSDDASYDEIDEKSLQPSEVRTRREEIEKLLSNDRILSSQEITKLEKQLDELRRSLRTAELILSQNIESEEAIYKNAEVRVQNLKQWILPKRLQIVTIGSKERFAAPKAESDNQRKFRVTYVVHAKPIAGAFKMRVGTTYLKDVGSVTTPTLDLTLSGNEKLGDSLSPRESQMVCDVLNETKIIFVKQRPSRLSITGATTEFHISGKDSSADKKWTPELAVMYLAANRTAEGGTRRLKLESNAPSLEALMKKENMEIRERRMGF